MFNIRIMRKLQTASNIFYKAKAMRTTKKKGFGQAHLKRLKTLPSGAKENLHLWQQLSPQGVSHFFFNILIYKSKNAVFFANKLKIPWNIFSFTLWKVNKNSNEIRMKAEKPKVLEKHN